MEAAVSLNALEFPLQHGGRDFWQAETIGPNHAAAHIRPEHLTKLQSGLLHKLPRPLMNAQRLFQAARIVINELFELLPVPEGDDMLKRCMDRIGNPLFVR